LNHLMESNQSTRLGAERGAMPGIGQGSQRRRWADLAHRRPVFHARWTSLRPTCGRQTTAWAVPGQQTRKTGQMIQYELILL